jgi:formyl-CoA transferase
MNTNKKLPLEGIRVIDFTQVFLGPSATQMLGDFGADVIKIENPNGGDLSRRSFGAVDEKGMNNPSFCSMNRNKRSLALDLGSEEGRQTICRMIKTADVVVSNFRPGVMDRLGLGYESVRAINPRIIYASGSGFGSSGPYAHKGGQDVLAQAMSGVMMRRADSTLPITIYPTPLCDYTTGMHLVQAILAALIGRLQHGEGQHVEVSMYDSMIAMQMQEAAGLLNDGKETNWAERPLTGVFDTSDGALVLVGAFKKNPLRDICQALNIEDLSEQFPDLAAQQKAKPYLQNCFKKEFAKESTAFWVERLEAEDLLCSPVRTLAATLEDDQTKLNGMIETIQHPLGGKMRLVSSPVHFMGIDRVVRRPPPLLGEHNKEILAELAETTRLSGEVS